MTFRLPAGSFFFFFASLCLAQSTNNLAFKPFYSAAFIENKGQIIDQNNKPNPAVLYLLNTPGINVQLRRGGFSYDLFTPPLNPLPKKGGEMGASTPLPFWGGAGGGVNFHRIDFDLLNSNPDCEIITSDPSDDYLNYYTTGTPVNGIREVRHFQTVTYKNIYPGIDLEFMIIPGQTYKYNFVIRPGARIDNIKLKISGADDIHLSNNSLIMTTRIGVVVEQIPESWFVNKDSKTKIKIHFQELLHGEYSFKVDNQIPENSTLVIDPTSIRLWGTYYGGVPTDNGIVVLVDNTHNVILCGYTLSFTYIATTGAYDTTRNGYYDVFIAKFTANGVRLWGTYYGGDGNDFLYGAATDILGNIYIGGETASDSCIASPGAFQETTTSIYNGGPTDAFLAKFSPNGWRIWGTYYGGVATDGGTDVAVDRNCNVYIVGYTLGSTNYGTSGVYQPSYFSPGDGFLSKFDSTGQRIWGTYYGHSCHFEGCSVDTSGIIYAVGVTTSTDTIASQGAFQTVYGGGMSDLFLVAFNQTGQRLWGTYYGGPVVDGNSATGGEPVVRCKSDGNGNVIITGFTTSASGIASTGAWQTILGGSQDGFIAKFNYLGQRIWGTYYGGSNMENINGCSIGSNGDVFFTGETNSPDGIATPGSYMPVINVGNDAFLVKFDSSGQRQWGTYFGGENSDIGWSCKYITDDTIYFCGNTTSSTKIASSGAHQEIYNGQTDAFLEKFIECWPISPAGAISGPASVCQNTNGVVYSTIALAHAVNYAWTLPPGAVITSGSGTTSITVAFNGTASSGNIMVKGLNKCNESGDSSVLAIAVHSRPIPSISGVDSICRYQSSLFITQPGMNNYSWTLSPGGSFLSGGTSSSDSARVKWTTLGANWVRVNYTNANNCTGLVAGQKDVWVKQEGSALTTTPLFSTICSGDSIHILLTASPPVPVFSWTASGSSPSVSGYSGGSGTRIDQKLINIASGTETVTFSITPLGPGCPGATVDYVVTVNPNLPVGITIIPSSNPVCASTSVTFTATPVNGGTTPFYQWKVNGITAGGNNPVYSYIPVNGDLVTCTMTSSLTCVSGNPASSNQILMVIDSNFPVGVSISASANPVCEGTSVTFTATPVNGGTTPVFQWKVNGNNAGINSSTYSYIPVNGDLVKCILTSNLNCSSNNPATSNTLSITINNPPQVTFTRCFDSITTTNAKPLKLKGGIPLGGTYSGPGVNSGYFYPNLAGTGTKTITYTYINSALCSAQSTVTIVTRNASPVTCGNPVTDIRDNKVYPTVQIGSQCWMASNLNYGTMILSSTHQRDNCIPEKYCYNDLTANCQLGTANYQWDELMRYDDTPGLQGLCPPGWHVPTENDWNTLFANYINNAFAGSPLKYSGYSGFNALLTGVRFMNKTWSFDGFATYFWSSTSHGSLKAWAYAMNDFDPSVAAYPALRSNAFSVRCLKD